MIVCFDTFVQIGLLIKKKMSVQYEPPPNVLVDLDINCDERQNEYILQLDLILEQIQILLDIQILIIIHPHLFIIVKQIKVCIENDIPGGYDIKTLSEYDLKLLWIEPVKQYLLDPPTYL